MTTTEMRNQDELTDDELDRVTGGLDPLMRRQIATAFLNGLEAIPVVGVLSQLIESYLACFWPAGP